MPPRDMGSPLEAALSYYSSIVVMTAEGDSVVSEDTLEGLGTTGFLLQALFGSILKLAQPSPAEQSSYIPPSALNLPLSSAPSPSSSPSASSPSQPPGVPAGPTVMSTASAIATAAAAPARNMAAIAVAQNGGGDSSSSSRLAGLAQPIRVDGIGPHPPPSPRSAQTRAVRPRGITKSRLTQYLPEPGYFLAGALAGGISRTATAPLDRLKVVLLVSTRNTDPTSSIAAARRGHPLLALRNAGKPITDAIASLYKAGGLRTFFAGIDSLSLSLFF